MSFNFVPPNGRPVPVNPFEVVQTSHGPVTLHRTTSFHQSPANAFIQAFDAAAFGTGFAPTPRVSYDAERQQLEHRASLLEQHEKVLKLEIDIRLRNVEKREQSVEERERQASARESYLQHVATEQSKTQRHIHEKLHFQIKHAGASPGIGYSVEQAFKYRHTHCVICKQKGHQKKACPNVQLLTSKATMGKLNRIANPMGQGSQELSGHAQASAGQDVVIKQEPASNADSAMVLFGRPSSVSPVAPGVEGQAVATTDAHDAAAVSGI